MALCSHTVSHKVAFAESDPAGIAHFTSFFAWFEQAEHGLLAQCGVPVMERVEGALRGWPRVKAAFDFRAPAHFGELLTVTVRLEEAGVRSLRFSCEVRRDGAGGEIVATGEMVTVYAAMTGEGQPRALPLPDVFLQRLRTTA